MPNKNIPPEILLVTVCGENQPETLQQIHHLVLNSGCELQDCRISVLATDVTAIFMVLGQWNNIAKLEAQLKREQCDSKGIQICFKRVEDPAKQFMPYAVEIVCPDSAGLVPAVSSFFMNLGASIEDLSCRSYRAPYTQMRMCTLNLIVGIPETLSIGLLRERFMDFCERCNIDALLEPVKG